MNLTFAMSRADLSNAPPAAGGDPSDEAKHFNAKVGYKWGVHAVSFAYFQGEDQTFQGDEGKAYTLGYAWNPIRWAEVYANYILYSLDHTRAGIADAQDITIFAVGTRVRF